MQKIEPMVRVLMVVAGPSGCVVFVEAGAVEESSRSGNGNNNQGTQQASDIAFETLSNFAILSLLITLQRRVDDLGGELAAAAISNHDATMRRLACLQQGV